MSKTKKCPGCGSQIPASMRYCGWCGYDMKAGGSDRIETLPRPTAVSEEPSPEAAPLREVRPADAPRPTETARRLEEEREYQPAKRKRRGGALRTVVVLLVIAAVIAAAVYLVLRMNQPVEPVAPSETFDAVHVINTEGEEIPSAPAATAPAEATAAPAETAAPEPVEEEPEATTDGETVYISGVGVNLRTGPGTGYDVAATLDRGTELTRTGNEDGWSRVTYDGKEYYVSSSLITTEKPETSANAGYSVSAAEDTVVVTTAAHIRKGPGTDYDVVATLDPGTELKRSGTSGSWSEVVYNGEKVFIASSLITKKDASEVTSQHGTLTVTEKANVRSGPGTGYDILGVAEVDSNWEMTGRTENNWYQITYNGKTGYIAGNLVKVN